MATAFGMRRREAPQEPQAGLEAVVPERKKVVIPERKREDLHAPVHTISTLAANARRTSEYTGTARGANLNNRVAGNKDAHGLAARTPEELADLFSRRIVEPIARKQAKG